MMVKGLTFECHDVCGSRASKNPKPCQHSHGSNVFPTTHALVRRRSALKVLPRQHPNPFHQKLWMPRCRINLGEKHPDSFGRRCKFQGYHPPRFNSFCMFLPLQNLVLTKTTYYFPIWGLLANFSGDICWILGRVFQDEEHPRILMNLGS